MSEAEDIDRDHLKGFIQTRIADRFAKGSTPKDIMVGLEDGRTIIFDLATGDAMVVPASDLPPPKMPW